MEKIDRVIILKVYKEIKKFSNEELRFLVKDIVSDNKKMSPNALKLFNFYYDDEPDIGIDRFVQIRKFLEHEIIERIEKDLF